MIVGEKLPQLEGRKSRVSEVTAITKRSNHMPMFTKIDTTKSTAGLRRNFRIQNSWGLITLHETMIQ